jgi:hypothetical protein
MNIYFKPKKGCSFWVKTYILVIMANYSNWTKTLSSTIRSSRKHYSLRMRMAELSQKYYGTTDFSKLKPYQLDKIITWTTQINPNKGSSKDRRHGRTLGRFIKGKI